MRIESLPIGSRVIVQKHLISLPTLWRLGFWIERDDGVQLTIRRDFPADYFR
jgi:hypothetical protein